jgi:hypothetical protein
VAGKFKTLVEQNSTINPGWDDIFCFRSFACLQSGSNIPLSLGLGLILGKRMSIAVVLLPGMLTDLLVIMGTYIAPIGQ